MITNDLIIQKSKRQTLPLNDRLYTLERAMYMTKEQLSELGKTLWAIAHDLRGAVNSDDFRDYMLSFLFLRYLSDIFEAAAKKVLGPDYPNLNEEDRRAPLAVWYEHNVGDVQAFGKQMRRKTH